MMITVGGVAADIACTALPTALGVSGSPACEAADISAGGTAFAFGERIAAEEPTRHPLRCAHHRP